ncbi:MAG: DUF4238 domain-containing protein [Porphyromonadaceae bacterium]|nr:MAG: DUF4238 domain-containing protein [Porphyromonadaceae bacterium]
MNNIKKSQHYVWKNYLKPWTANGQIYCLRDGKVFKTSPDNIAQQSYFYKSNPINIEEINLANYYIGIFDPAVKELLSSMLRIYHITANNDDYLMKCGIEDFHGIVETNFIPVLTKLYEVDLSFFGSSKEKSDFSFFIGCQYSRTNNMRSRFITSEITYPKNVDKENFAKIFSLFSAAIIGNWVYSKAKQQFLVNKTGEPFITGDQPVFNLKGTDSMEIAPSEFELFYPISPSQAIILSEKNTQPLMEIEDIEKVKWFNRKIWKNANEQIYAKYEENLKVK